jgi:hypothetical protein
VAGRGKRQRGRVSGGRASWRSGGAGRAAKGQLAAREIAGEGTASGAAAKQRGVHCKVTFSFKSARGSL